MTDHVGEAVALLKTIVDHNPTKELICFMQDKAGKSRKHELQMAKLNATAPSSQQPEVASQMQQ